MNWKLIDTAPKGVLIQVKDDNSKNKVPITVIISDNSPLLVGDDGAVVYDRQGYEYFIDATHWRELVY